MWAKWPANTSIKETLNGIDDPNEQATFWALKLGERLGALTIDNLFDGVGTEYIEVDELDFLVESQVADALMLDCFPNADSLADAEISMGGAPVEQQHWPILAMSPDFDKAWLVRDVDPDTDERWLDAPIPKDKTEHLMMLIVRFRRELIDMAGQQDDEDDD